VLRDNESYNVVKYGICSVVVVSSVVIQLLDLYHYGQANFRIHHVLKNPLHIDDNFGK